MAEGRWSAHVTDRWNIGAAPNGGYLMAVTARAMAEALAHPDPFTVTSHYLARCDPGPVDIEVESLHGGRRHTFGVARVLRDGAERLRVTAAFGDLDAREGPTAITAQPPDLPPPDECIATPADLPGLPEIVRRFDYRYDPQHAGLFATGTPTGTAEMAGWVRFADGRPPDALSLLAFADAFPPAVFNLDPTFGWVPTVELTVHVRNRPRPGWLRAVFRTRVLDRGYLEEDGELWDEDGVPVALSRQLALVLPPRPGLS